MYQPHIATGMRPVDVNGTAASELNAALHSRLPLWLSHLLTSDSLLASVVIPTLVIVLCSAVAKTFAREYLSPLPAILQDRWLAYAGYVERSVEVTQSSDYYVRKRFNDGLNGELQTAVKLFIGNNAAVCFDTIARVSLLETANVRSNSRGWSRMNIHRSTEDLKAMKLIVGPEPDRDFKIPNTNPPIYLRVEVRNQTPSTTWEKRQKTVFTLTTRHTSNAAGRAHIDDFVKRCYESYRETMGAAKKAGRYLYQLQATPGSGGLVMVQKSSGGGDGDGEGGGDEGKAAEADIPPPSRFKRYKLSDDKDFDSLFFPAKSDILRLVDDFRLSRGKFAIEGFPRKLGLLLSGPSGTGKTALVKALATYLGRHIITLQLEKIKTNQQLYDIMFEEQYSCTNTDGKGKSETIPNDKVIFLMEVDGAFDIVRSRKADPASAASTPALKSDRMRDLLFNRADQLDLAGLLNALDGVVDSPGRVVIMSTSAVTELDAALVRPGRINRILHMNYLTKECAAQMLQHHFGEEAFSGAAADAFAAEWARKESDAAAGISRTASAYMSPSAAAAARRQSGSATPQLSPRERDAPNGSPSFAGAFRMAPAELEQLCIDNDTLPEVMAAFSRFPDEDTFHL